MPEPTTFRFVNEDTVFTLPWEVAIREGLFERAGYQVEVPDKNPANTAVRPRVGRISSMTSAGCPRFAAMRVTAPPSSRQVCKDQPQVIGL